MVTAERTLTLFLVTITFSSETVVDGFSQTCPESAIVDLTNASSDSFGFVDESGNIFPVESIHSENDKIFGCLCDIKTCVPLCCPEGYALSSELGCVDDEFTPNYSHHQEWWFHSSNYSKFVDNACEEPTLLTSLRIRAYELFKDNSIFLTEEKRIVGLGRYCVFRERNSPSHTMTLICQNYLELIDQPTCFIVSNAVGIVFILVTIVVYRLIPKLMNLQGWILQSFLVSYICCMIVFTAFYSEIASPDETMSDSISGFALFYSGLACLLWLNVMSFDVWRRFRSCQSSHNGNSKKLQRQRFVWYSIYAWVASAGPPASLIITTILLQASSYELLQDYVVIVLTAAPILCIIVSTLYFHTSAALRIRWFCKKEAPPVDKHYKKNKEWFNLYFKLFVVMMCHLILWVVISFVYNHYALVIFVFMLEALKDAYVFVIFVWRDDVRQSFKKRYFKTLRRLGFFLPHEPTTVADETKETIVTRLYP